MASLVIPSTTFPVNLVPVPKPAAQDGSAAHVYSKEELLCAQTVLRAILVIDVKHVALATLETLRVLLVGHAQGAPTAAAMGT